MSIAGIALNGCVAMKTGRRTEQLASRTGALPQPASPRRGPATIALFNQKTREEGVATYRIDNRYVPEELQKVDWLLRDTEADLVAPIDVELMEFLYDLQRTVGVTDTVEVLSGYRSPRTNAAVRARSGGAARHSLHMQGQAVDFRLPSVKTKVVREAAVAMQRGGVGLYANQTFIHIDSGSFRTWS